MSKKPLYWEASYEIVLALQEAHTEANIEDIGTQQLYQMIVDLPQFADDPLLANDALLRDILREWYEESTT